MRPDIALVSAYPPPDAHHAGRTGVASYTANLARALDAAGASVVVVAAREDDCPRTFTDGGVRVQYAFRRGAAAPIRAASAARATGAALIHVQHEMFMYGGPATAATLPAALAVRRTKPVVVTMHQVIDPHEIDAGFVRMHHVRTNVAMARSGIRTVNAALRRLADAVVVHEPSFARTIRGATVIPHGVESRPRIDRRSARSRLDLDDVPVVLCFGFLAPYKGLEAALEASRRAGGAFRLVVAGDNHPRANGYGEQLRRTWDGHARFTGRVEESDLSSWFAACSVALFPYQRPFASSGAVALALAYGTPVLLSEALAGSMDAPHELITSLDPPSLAQRLASLTRSEQAIGPVVTASQRLADGRRWDEVARQHLALYEEVTDVRRPVGRRVRSGQSR